MDDRHQTETLKYTEREREKSTKRKEKETGKRTNVRESKGGDIVLLIAFLSVSRQ